MANSYPRFYLVVGVVILGVLLALTACGDDDDDAGDGEGDGGGSEAATVDILLSEFIVEADPDSAAAGEVTFDVQNEGEEVHEFVIVKTDLDPDALPTAEDGSFDEEGSGVEVVDEIEDIEAGAGDEITVDLDAGAYVLLCNLVEEEESGEVESHFAEGMFTEFAVE